LSCNCSMREAPVITVDTCGFFVHQAIASCASVPPNPAAIGSSWATAALRRASVRPSRRNAMFSIAPRTGRYATAVLAGQQTRGERAPGGEAEAGLVVERRELLLDLATVEQVVLRLLHQRLVQVMALGHLPRFADRLGRPLARAPVQRLALRDDV